MVLDRVCIKLVKSTRLKNKKDEFLKNLAYTENLLNNILINMGSGCSRSEYPDFYKEKIVTRIRDFSNSSPRESVNRQQEHVQ